VDVARAEEVAGERNIAVVAMHAEVEDIGERIVLGLETVGPDFFHKFLDVGRDRFEAERMESLAVQFAHLGADADAAAVPGCADRPDFVRQMAKAHRGAGMHRRRFLVTPEPDDDG